MNTTQMVRELMEEIHNGGVSGGGHLVVGSIKFVGGMRKAVLAKLAEKITACRVDGVAAVRADRRRNAGRAYFLYRQSAVDLPRFWSAF